MERDRPMAQCPVSSMTSQVYNLGVNPEMREALNEHQKHHKTSPLDGLTTPYSIMDKKHKGPR